MSVAKIWGCLYLLGLVGHLLAVSVTWSAIFLGLFKVMCYFPHGKSTIWGIYSENFLFFVDHLSKSKFVPGNRMQMLSVSHSSAGGFFRMKAMRWIRSFKFCHFHFPQYLANENQMALLESWIPRLIITFPLKLIFVGDFEGKHFQTHPNDPLNTRLLGPNSTAHRNSELLRNAAPQRPGPLFSPVCTKWCKPEPYGRWFAAFRRDWPMDGSRESNSPIKGGPFLYIDIGISFMASEWSSLV